MCRCMHAGCQLSSARMHACMCFVACAPVPARKHRPLGTLAAPRSAALRTQGVQYPLTVVAHDGFVFRRHVPRHHGIACHLFVRLRFQAVRRCSCVFFTFYYFLFGFIVLVFYKSQGQGTRCTVFLDHSHRTAHRAVVISSLRYRFPSDLFRFPTPNQSAHTHAALDPSCRLADLHNSTQHATRAIASFRLGLRPYV